MSTPTATRRYRALFGPFDSKEWTLPEPVIEARKTATRIAAAMTRIVEPPPPQEALNAAVASALTAEHPQNTDVSAILDHDQLVTQRDALVSVLRTAAERSGAHLNDVIREHRDEIITAHLRLAGEQLWSEIVKTVKELGEIEISDTDALLRAPDKVRSAWLDLDGMAGKYARIREAGSRLLLHTNTQPVHDVHGDHAEFKAGLCMVAGPNWRGTNIAAAPKMPWPTDPRGRLAWLVRAGAKPWWPTVSERDQAWLVAHQEQHERTRNQQRLNRIAQQWSASYA